MKKESTLKKIIECQKRSLLITKNNNIFADASENSHC